MIPLGKFSLTKVVINLFQASSPRWEFEFSQQENSSTIRCNSLYFFSWVDVTKRCKENIFDWKSVVKLETMLSDNTKMKMASFYAMPSTAAIKQDWSEWGVCITWLLCEYLPAPFQCPSREAVKAVATLWGIGAVSWCHCLCRGRRDHYHSVSLQLSYLPSPFPGPLEERVGNSSILWLKYGPSNESRNYYVWSELQ